MSRPKAFGFSREERLLNSADFRRTTRGRTGRRTDHLRVFMTPSGSRRRLGLTVSKRVGNAVQRNRVKRRLREFFRLNKDRLPIADIVIIAQPGAARLDYQALDRELTIALRPSWRRANLSCG